MGSSVQKGQSIYLLELGISGVFSPWTPCTRWLADGRGPSTRIHAAFRDLLAQICLLPSDSKKCDLHINELTDNPIVPLCFLKFES